MAKRATKKLQTPDGADVKPEVAAATLGAAEAQAGGRVTSPSAADPAGAEGVPAAPSEQSRDAADTPATDRKAGVDAGIQPEAAHRPPVAGTVISVRSRRPQGRRRAGRAFTSEAVEINTADLSPMQLDGLLTDPELIVDPPQD